MRDDEDARASDGGKIVLGRDEGGARHFLHGHPVRCGTQLEYLDEDEWQPCRYESERRPPLAAIYGTTRTTGQCVQRGCALEPHFFASDIDVFRWPAGSRETRELAIGRRPYPEGGLPSAEAAGVRELRT